ncbi:MAG TPA: PASTA domain-containing protein [Candidatus Limnocylindrales bacterium]|nr:PASTA domain-containing protein [Candidatus Limnocylindrales bacterium]
MRFLLMGLMCLLAACAQPPTHPTPVANAPSESPAPEGERMSMPQLVASRAAEADGTLIKAGLVPILRYEPGIVTDAGTVVNTEPAGGSLVELGATVVVYIAGSPGKTLAEYVDGHRETFTGLGVDGNGVLVVGVVQSADLAKEMAALTEVAGGKSFRVQTCSRSWVELTRLQVELSKRRFLPGADKMAFATAIDPLACALRMTADLSDAEVAELTGRYSGALVIQKGHQARR